MAVFFKFFRSYFRQCDDFIFSFWNFLTFRGQIVWCVLSILQNKGGGRYLESFDGKEVHITFNRKLQTPKYPVWSVQVCLLFLGEKWAFSAVQVHIGQVASRKWTIYFSWRKKIAVIESDNTINWIMICSATGSLIYHYISIKCRFENEWQREDNCWHCQTMWQNDTVYWQD